MRRHVCLVLTELLISMTVLFYMVISVLHFSTITTFFQVLYWRPNFDMMYFEFVFSCLIKLVKLLTCSVVVPSYTSHYYISVKFCCNAYQITLCKRKLYFSWLR